MNGSKPISDSNRPGNPVPQPPASADAGAVSQQRMEPERERLLGEFAAQRALLDAIVENTTVHLVYLDRDFNFLRVNAAYAKAGRKAPEEFIGHNHFEFYPHAENQAIFERVRETGEPFSVREKPFVSPDMPECGTTYWDWTLTPIKNQAGEVAGLVFALNDVTDQVRTREQLLAAERGRTELAERLTAEINHRMKNNLMLLAGVLEMQAMEEPRESRLAEALRDAATRISALSVVHEHLYAGQSGKVELRDIMQRIGELGICALGGGNVALAVSGEKVYVSSKMASTIAILANELITNAIKHGAADADGKRRIKIKLGCRAGEFKLTIWNSGSPIPADFDICTRQRLGLHLAQMVVEHQLGGKFSLRPHKTGTVSEVILDESTLAFDHKG